MLGLYDTFDRVTRGDLTAVCSDSTHVQVLGRDFSGEVVDVGQAVTKFEPGDEVSLVGTTRASLLRGLCVTLLGSGQIVVVSINSVKL